MARKDRVTEEHGCVFSYPGLPHSEGLLKTQFLRVSVEHILSNTQSVVKWLVHRDPCP